MNDRDSHWIGLFPESSYDNHYPDYHFSLPSVGRDELSRLDACDPCAAGYHNCCRGDSYRMRELYGHGCQCPCSQAGEADR